MLRVLYTAVACVAAKEFVSDFVSQDRELSIPGGDYVWSFNRGQVVKKGQQVDEMHEPAKDIHYEYTFTLTNAGDQESLMIPITQWTRMARFKDIESFNTDLQKTYKAKLIKHNMIGTKPELKAERRFEELDQYFVDVVANSAAVFVAFAKEGIAEKLVTEEQVQAEAERKEDVRMAELARIEAERKQAELELAELKEQARLAALPKACGAVPEFSSGVSVKGPACDGKLPEATCALQCAAFFSKGHGADLLTCKSNGQWETEFTCETDSTKIIIIVAGVVALLALILLVVCCCRSRKAVEEDEETQRLTSDLYIASPDRYTVF